VNGAAVTRLTLTDFRCYDRARLAADARPVVLTGPNGAGKTNLLEALSFLAPGRGLRGAKPADIQRRGGPAGGVWGVAATVETPLGRVEIGTGRDAESESERRAVRIDGRPTRGQVALAERLAVVWLTPQMDRLFVDGASGRRKFLDRLTFGFDPAHAGRLTRYEHALRERTRLLRDPVREPAWLDAVEATMAETGVAIACARRDMVRRLNSATQGVDPFPKAAVQVSGAVEQWLEDDPALAVEDLFKDHLTQSRTADAESGGASIGPHRSDFVVHHVGKGMPAELCSTGEQKALLVAIVLANARLLAAERGAAPILLLDEVAAHLDADRRSALYREILALGAQTWLTGTDEALFAAFGQDALFLRVHQAAIAPSA
jgi:DNA replication and repair protein RecF